MNIEVWVKGDLCVVGQIDSDGEVTRWDVFGIDEQENMVKFVLDRKQILDLKQQLNSRIELKRGKK